MDAKSMHGESSRTLKASHGQDDDEERTSDLREDATRTTGRETAGESAALDIEAPVMASGLVTLLGHMPLAFFAANLGLFVLGLLASSLAGRCGAGAGWRGDALAVLAFSLELGYCMALVFCQLRVFHGMQGAAAELPVQRSRLQARLPAPAEEVEAPASPGSWLRLPRCWGASRAPQETGRYYLAARTHEDAHFDLMRRHYCEHLDSGPCDGRRCLCMVAGLVQVWEMGFTVLQPGILRACYGPDSDGLPLSLVHGGWASLIVLVSLGAVQFWNFWWLMRNAFGTATGEREWLAYDLLQGEQKEVSFLAAIDNAGENSFDAAELQSAGSGSQQHRSHLNLTYAWMCASSAAASFGAAHTADMCDHIAAKTQEMVESSSNYRFRLRRIAEWDIKKVGMICRVVQAFCLVLVSVELLGAPGLGAWRLPAVAILLGALVAARQGLHAGSYCCSQEVAAAGRMLEVRAAVCFVLALALLTWLWAAFGLRLRFASCRGQGFSLLRSLATCQLGCAPG
mmetsp:Transcript_80936/g.229141  ORF Transcript_80936/g.229141 Transcript_80936/m.229141 type:complete len:513 (-) Transcript_80936:46-1584(-)